MSPKSPQKISRKIYFYRALTDLDEDGSPTPFDPTTALRHINQLGFSAEGRYLDTGDTTLCCWVHRTGPPHQFRLGHIRRTGLPLVEEGGRLADLQIPDDSGLVEVTHIVVFEDNIVGADFNFYGPRLGRLGWYLSAKCRGLCDPVSFEPLVRRDVEAALRRLGSIRLFHLKIRSSYAPNMTEVNEDLAAAFEAAGRAGHAEEVDLILTPKRYSRRGNLSDRLRHATLRLAGDPDLQQAASIFKVRGPRTDTGESTEVDILRDQLVAEEQIMRQTKRGRSLDERSAYEAIMKAHDGLERELSEAATVGAGP